MRHDPDDPRHADATNGRAGERDALAEILGDSTLSEHVLVHLVARRAAARLDPLDPHQRCFYDWLAREARAGESAEEREATERAARRFAERVLRRSEVARAVSRAGLRVVDASPPRLATDGRVSEHAAPCYDLAVAAGAGRELWDEPSTEWIRLPEELTGSAYVALRVHGDSMAPLLHTGDTILVQLGADLALDRIVVARHPADGYVVKRVARIGPREIELASLNEAYAPMSIPADASLVLGVVVLRWCPHGVARAT